jgi:DnaJ family protein C protein 9
LQALILKTKKKMGSFLDGLAEKYSEPELKSRTRSGKNKKRSGVEEDDDPEQHSTKKARGRVPPPPDIDDKEFERLQQQLFPNKSKPKAEASGSKVGRQRKTNASK